MQKFLIVSWDSPLSDPQPVRSLLRLYYSMLWYQSDIGSSPQHHAAWILVLPSGNIPCSLYALLTVCWEYQSRSRCLGWIWVFRPMASFWLHQPLFIDGAWGESIWAPGNNSEHTTWSYRYHNFDVPVFGAQTALVRCPGVNLLAV